MRIVVDHYKRVLKEAQIGLVIQFNFNSTFWRRKIHLDPQVDQGDFSKINCNDLFTSICFHKRLDTLSVNSRIYRVSYYLHGLQLHVRCYLEFWQLLRPLVRSGKVPLLSLIMLFTY